MYISDKTNHYSITFSQEQTKLLLEESNKAYHTQINDLLLTALAYALAEITNRKVNYITLEVMVEKTLIVA